MHKTRRLNDGLPWLTFGFYQKPDDPPSGGTGTKDDSDKSGKEDKDKNKGGSEDKTGSGDSDKKEGKLELNWKEDSKGRKFFTGPDGRKYYDEDQVTQTVSSRLNEDRDKRKQDADKQALLDKEEYKKLYETADTKVKELESKAALADSLVESQNKAIDERIKEWPSEIKDMDPGKENITARIGWVEKADKAVKKMNSGGAIDGEHGKQGNKKEIDKVMGRITDPNRYAIPGQKK